MTPTTGPKNATRGQGGKGPAQSQKPVLLSPGRSCVASRRPPFVHAAQPRDIIGTRAARQLSSRRRAEQEGGRRRAYHAVQMTSTPGKSQPVSTTSDGFNEEETVDIPSTGVDFYHYRRSLFLAGLPYPSPSSAPPATYSIPKHVPPALPPKVYAPVASSSVGRLESLLAAEGSEEREDVWHSGVGSVARGLAGGKRLARGLRLGLVIKILKAGWIRDGTWPIDPVTLRAAAVPPDSPIQVKQALANPDAMRQQFQAEPKPLSNPDRRPTSRWDLTKPLAEINQAAWDRSIHSSPLPASAAVEAVEAVVEDGDVRVGNNVYRNAEATVEQEGEGELSDDESNDPVSRLSLNDDHG